MAEIILNMKNRMYYDQVNFDEIYDKFEEGSGAKLTLNCIKDYEDELKKRNIIDFPMLEFKFLNKLKNHKLDIFLDNIKIILIDEYQDTNFAQHLIIQRLCEKKGRLCVVGDDAQSIYSFRGANIDNILKFQNIYRGCKVFKLERNYRSTQNIVNVANSLIDKNKEQIPKNIYSKKEEGSRIKIMALTSDYEEAYTIAGLVWDMKLRTHGKYMDTAILYRTNAQSRILEEAFRKR